MKSALVRGFLGMALASGMPIAALYAETESKALPTLLIKGEVVSIDANDPSATLLKVKDRYGFETPIFLSSETKIAQGDATIASSSLAAGTPVEVEYNFDINTAKRHAVSVKVSKPAQAATAPASPAVSSPSVSASVAAQVTQPAATPAAAAPSNASSAQPAEASPATQQ